MCGGGHHAPAAHRIDEIIAYVRRMRGARGRPPAGWESLTPTERQVAELVGQGLTNPQIAARLLVSRDTVKGHVSAALRKLGVANRTESPPRSPDTHRPKQRHLGSRDRPQ